MEGIEVTKNLAKNPVIAWIKKHPAASAGILGGSLLLVYLFKPEETGGGDFEELTGATGYPAANSVIDSGLTGGTGGTLTGGNGSDYLSGSGSLWPDTLGPDYLTDIFNDIDDLTAKDLISQDEMALRGMPQQLVYEDNITIPTNTAAADIVARLIRNSLTARQIYDRTGSWNDPAIAALNAENIDLSSSLGGSYNPSTGVHDLSSTDAAASVRAMMAANSAKAKAIYEQSGSWSDPAIKALNEENQLLGKTIGLVYNPVTGTYSAGSGVNTGTTTTINTSKPKTTTGTKTPIVGGRPVKTTIVNKDGTKTQPKATDLGNGTVRGTDGKIYAKNDSTNAAMKAGVWAV